MLYDPSWKAPVEQKAKKVKPKSKRKTWRTLLLKAADILETKGWIRGSLHSADGFCTIGALRYADNKENIVMVPSPTCQKAEILLNHHLGTSVITWNDRIVSSKEEVIATLRRAAEHEQ